VLVWVWVLVRVWVVREQGSSGKTIVVENPMSLDENGKLVSPPPLLPSVALRCT